METKPKPPNRIRRDCGSLTCVLSYIIRIAVVFQGIACVRGSVVDGQGGLCLFLFLSVHMIRISRRIWRYCMCVWVCGSKRGRSVSLSISLSIFLCTYVYVHECLYTHAQTSTGAYTDKQCYTHTHTHRYTHTHTQKHTHTHTYTLTYTYILANMHPPNRLFSLWSILTRLDVDFWRIFQCLKTRDPCNLSLVCFVVFVV